MRKRILVLTTRFPYPVIGGDKLRIHYLCKELAKDNDLTLLSLASSKEEMDAEADSSVFKEVHKVFLPKWKSLLNTALAVPTTTPLQLAYYRSEEFAHKVDELTPKHDMVVAHLIRAGQYVQKSMPIPRVLEMTDAISMNYKRINQLGGGGLKGKIFSFEYPRLENYETKVAGDFDLSIVVSPFDKEHLETAAGQSFPNLVVAGNGVDLDRSPFTGPGAEPTAVFIGNMNSVQNIDACVHFAEDILPRVKARIPGFKFKVVGNAPQQVMDTLAKYPDVIATGRVASIATAAKDGFCGVCPVRLGAGVQNKVLEYMALGLPAVTSKVGHEGIEAAHGEELMVAEDVDAFVDALVTLWADSAPREKLAGNGRAFVENKMSWAGKLSPAASRITGLLGQGSAAASSEPVSVTLEERYAA